MNTDTINTDTTNTGTTNTAEHVTDKVVVLISRGLDDERATVAWTLAMAGAASGQDVTVFLVSAGVDLARKGAVDVAQMNPKDPPMRELIANFRANGGTIWACPPCSALRGYTEDDFMDGVSIVGAGPFYELIKAGATTICL